MNPLSSTSVYKYAETAGGIPLSMAVAKLADSRFSAEFIGIDRLEDVLAKIRHKSFNFKAKFAVIEMIRNGTVRLVYNHSVSLTAAMPYFTFKKPTGGFGSIVNITNYATIDKDGSVYIDPLILYALVLCAGFSLKADSLDAVLASSGIPELYADMFVGVVVRLSNLDMTRREKIHYIMTKFAYMQLGYNEIRAADASKQSIKYLDEYTINAIDNAIPAASFANLEILVNTMREVLVECNGVTFGLIFDRWMKSYGEASAFAIEYIPYFIFVFTCLIMNCNNIINVKAIETIANKNTRKLLTLFDRIESTVQTSFMR